MEYENDRRFVSLENMGKVYIGKRVFGPTMCVETRKKSPGLVIFNTSN